MNNNYLEHYGIPRRSGRYPWGSGSRPFQGDSPAAKSSGKTKTSGKSGKTGLFKKGKTKTESSEEDISKISSEELQKRVSRLQLEKQYQDLMKKPKTVSKGRQILYDILESSTKKVGTQLVTYAMGSVVNAAFDTVISKEGALPKSEKARIAREAAEKAAKAAKEAKKDEKKDDK